MLPSTWGQRPRGFFTRLQPHSAWDTSQNKPIFVILFPTSFLRLDFTSKSHAEHSNRSTASNFLILSVDSPFPRVCDTWVPHGHRCPTFQHRGRAHTPGQRLGMAPTTPGSLRCPSGFPLSRPPPPGRSGEHSPVFPLPAGPSPPRGPPPPAPGLRQR